MILITGATGNNGQELIRQLTAMGQSVRALVRKPAEAAKLDGSNIEVVAGDFDLPETLETALQGVEKAFLLTPVAERFVQWQKDFIQAAQRAKIKHLVKFSGMGAHARSASLLLKLHAETDEVLRSSGVPFTILQPNSFHQNMLSSANTIKAQGVFYWPLKKASQSTVDIRDISAVAAKVFGEFGSRRENLCPHRTGSLDLSRGCRKAVVRARPENSVRGRTDLGGCGRNAQIGNAGLERRRSE